MAVPRDARLLSLILASKGIDDADDRVLQQLLDFSYRYTADVLQSAQVLADHASRPGPSKIEKEDIELAIQMRKRTEFIEPPPRDYLASLAHKLNVLPLPILPESFEVVRLPPPHQRLAEVNFDIVPGQEVLTENEDSDDDDDDNDDNDDEPQADPDEDDADGSDEDMEEVDVTEPVSIAVAPVVREMDDDYND